MPSFFKVLEIQALDLSSQFFGTLRPVTNPRLKLGLPWLWRKEQMMLSESQVKVPLPCTAHFPVEVFMPKLELRKVDIWLRLLCVVSR
jgi:hypothetical protein